MSQTINQETQPTFLFEISWEVINKVGGIFTVIRSKADTTVQEYGKDYFLLGPYNEFQCRNELQSCSPAQPEVIKALNILTSENIKIKTGKWITVKGTPFVILFDVDFAASRLRDYRKDFLRRTRIVIPWLDCEVNDAVIFGYLITRFFEELRTHLGKQVRLIAHFHEWISAIGLILCRQRGIDLATIFTTHATLLGRHLSAAQVDFHNYNQFYDCDQEAARRGFYSRYCIEKLAANVGQVFTTVSKTTADEAKCFLGRYPDLITPNGMNSDISAVFSERLQQQHTIAQEKIHNFIRGHFYG